MTHTVAMKSGSIPWSARGNPDDVCRAMEPATVPAWDEECALLPGASFFHRTAWSKVLVETYGHRPCYLRSRTAEGMRGLLPLMEVASPLTGRRGVSLPFTDLCPLLACDESVARGLFEQALLLGQERKWRYLELRGYPDSLSHIQPSVSFRVHELDLRPSVSELQQGMEQSARRAVRKAQQAGVEMEVTRTAEAVKTYFGLHCLTRKRHGVPVQPWRFFENVWRQVLDVGDGFVAVARWKGQPVAAAVFFQAGKQVVYKYGASDDRFQSMRPNNLLFWHVIQHCHAQGFERLHFGRSSLANEGLSRFKRSLGAFESVTSYARYHFGRRGWVVSKDRAEGPANAAFCVLPVALLRFLGRWLYPHMS